MKKVFYLLVPVIIIIAGLVYYFVGYLKPVAVIDVENPLALEVTQARSFYHAQDIKERLEDMGLKPYVVSYDDSIQGGKWYKILVGAQKDSVKLDQLKNNLEQNYHFQNIQKVDYQSIKGMFFQVKQDTIAEQKKILAQKPEVPQHIYDVITKFPSSKMFYIEKLFVFNTPRNNKEKFSIARILELNPIATDLPRGINLSIIWEKSEAFAEAIYKDNLYGDRLTIDILKMKPGTDQSPKIAQASFLPISLTEDEQLKIADEFSNKILDTGEYATEQKIKIAVTTHFKNMVGYKVVIEPEQGVFRTYLVLVDADGEYVLFCQSTAKTDEELFQILGEIGKGEGMIDYKEFYNCFYTLPDRLPEGDIFLGYFILKLGQDYAKNKDNAQWAKEMVGHWIAIGAYYTINKGGWDYWLFDLLTHQKSDYIYKDLYDKEETPTKNRVTVYGGNGNLITSWYRDNPLEINFAKLRYVCAVGNQISNCLSQKDLIARAEALQFKEDKKEVEPQVAEK